VPAAECRVASKHVDERRARSSARRPARQLPGVGREETNAQGRLGDRIICPRN